MKSVYVYYRNNIEAYDKRVNALKRKIHLMGTIRLLLVAVLFAVIWLLKGYDWRILLAGIVAVIIPFIVLMIYHNYLSSKKSYAEVLIDLCRNELKGLDYDFSAFDGAPERIDGTHSFSLDLDLFGERSFFQSVNRTVTYTGKNKLADWFTNPLTNRQEIENRQEAIKELSGLTRLRQHFYVSGRLNPGEKDDAHILSSLTQTTTFFANKLFWTILFWVVPIGWIGILGGLLTETIHLGIPVIFFMVCTFIGYFRVKQVNQIHESVNKMESIFKIYSKLIQSIEEDQFKSKILQDITSQFTCKEGKASAAIKHLSSHIGGLDQRGNMAGALLNIFTMRDMRNAKAVEEWKIIHETDIQRWFEALALFDALSSLAGFAFNHPDYIYPSFADSYFSMEGKGLGHPLVRRDVCVRNDISIEKKPWFMIVTGANMAGKSTYLRTIGINFVLACIGAPVWADELKLYPAALVTSLRTSDSLVSNESYFFAELKRLKMIIDRLQNGEELFIILDEILKGTNSVDKQKGSLALIKQFIRYQTCGIIATHDLILGSLQEEFPEDVKNYRFEADITNNELTFTYKLREGVAQNMNACFLMQKMGITV